MTAVLTERRKSPHRRRRSAGHEQQRLDIQGLRMFAMVTIFAFHLCGWPQGGFAMVDVFFVVSGFLITGNLLRMADKRGNVSFKKFYWNRVRRIIPAATVVLLLTYLTAVLLYRPFRAHEVGVDAFYAFIFMSNWWFAAEKTDYFAGGDSASPLQQYWTLSVEEQFYFVWPALVFVVGLIVARMAWTHRHRMGLAGAVMGTVIAGSLAWALYETATDPTRAYFDTLARVWELGAGALLATGVGLLARIPVAVKPWLSWTGLALIVATLFLITEQSPGFPAPWALLPVAGAALVIASGVGGEPNQWVLRNRVSVYIGNISYSLYLVHWPVIIFLAVLMPRGVYFYLTAVALTFGLAIASFHFVENPLRYADREKATRLVRKLRQRRLGLAPGRSAQLAAIGALGLLTFGLTAYAIHPPPITSSPPEMVSTASALPPSTTASDAPPQPAGQFGPALQSLQQEIRQALQATEWPTLDPPLDSIGRATSKDSPDIKLWYTPDIVECSRPTATEGCTWGASTAPLRVMLVGDSIALSYAGPFRDIALNSNGQIQVHLEALAGCRMMVNYMADSASDQQRQDCLAKRQHTVDAINQSKPDVVIIANAYNDIKQGGGSAQWADYRRQVVSQFVNSTRKLVWLAPPPDDKIIADCYGVAGSVPADCISRVTDLWLSVARTEQAVAASFGGMWFDTRPWFCTDEGLCPAFVGSTLMKFDLRHITRAYGDKITPVIRDSLTAAGIL
jgi:peptidoglycan/LPS O-acetylase OafA/YrhL